MTYKNHTRYAGLRISVLILAVMICLNLCACSCAADPPEQVSALQDEDTETVLEPLSNLSTLSAGDHFTFGSYPQSTDQPEPIEWRVLAAEDGKAVILSEYLLDAHIYDGSSSVWKNSELRAWLNGEFLNSAFSREEQSRIVDYGGDMVSLLNIGQVKKYLRTEESRVCRTTAYARKNGAASFEIDDLGWWWLRASGVNDVYAAFVDIYGTVYPGGDYIGNEKYCIRPLVKIEY